MYRHTGIPYSLNISGVKVFVDSWFKHFCNKYFGDRVKIVYFIDCFSLLIMMPWPNSFVQFSYVSRSLTWFIDCLSLLSNDAMG